ncbi:MAG: extracellular solute-binding protein family 1 [Paenibacillus sp.]|nr:extracellular solute-binding protein family 1 [Paenibacillus sp.]
MKSTRQLTSALAGRSRTKKYGGAVLSLALLLPTLLAGCGAGDSKSSPAKPGDAEPAGKPAALMPSEPVKLTIFSASGGNLATFNTQYGDAIRKKHPNISIDFIPSAPGSTIADLVAAKTPIDIIYGSIGVYPNISEYNLLADMTPLIRKHQYDVGKLETQAVEMQRQLANGGLYGLPVVVSVSGLYYNKDLFDKFGVAYPKDNMTWDDLYALAQKLTRVEGGVQYYGYTTSAQHQALTNQLSLAPVDPRTNKANLNSESWKRFMESITKIFQIPGYNLTSETASVAALRALFEQNPRAAMYTNFSGGTPPDTMNWDVVTVPYFKEAPEVGPQPYPAYWYVTANSANKDAAFGLIAYLTSEEFQIPFNRRGFATALKDAKIQSQFGQDMDKFKGKNVAAMFPKKPAAPVIPSAQNTIGITQLNNAFVEVVTGRKDINTALRDATEAADKAIAALPK